MREIKAFVRPSQIEFVIKGLEEIGVCGMTITPVNAIGGLNDTGGSSVSTEYMKRYTQVHKLEVVCRESDTGRIVELIRRLAHTGQPGDGLIFVTPVDHVIKIRTGETDHDALDPIQPTGQPPVGLDEE